MKRETDKALTHDNVQTGETSCEVRNLTDYSTLYCLSVSRVKDEFKLFPKYVVILWTDEDLFAKLVRSASYLG